MPGRLHIQLLFNMKSADTGGGVYMRESDCCVYLDVISISECEAVLQPMFDFTPNENGCAVVRMKRGSKPRGRLYSMKKAAATLVPCP